MRAGKKTATAWAGLVLVVVLGLLGLASSAPAGAQASSTTIDGQVLYTDGSPADGVVVDVFGGSADGERLTWLGDTSTDDFGQFEVNTGDLTNPNECWVLTLIAPGEDVFDATAKRWSNHTRCLDGAGSPETIQAVLRGQSTTATLAGLVLRGDAPAAGVVADLFRATGDGSRGAWLGDTETATDGSFSFSAEPGCYTVTVIGPEYQTFVGSGSKWFNQSTCLDGASSVELPPAVLNTTTSTASLVISVIDGGQPAEDVAADLFTGPNINSIVFGDGTYVRTERTGSDGEVRLQVEPGCHRVVVIAPEGRGFPEFGSRYAVPVRQCVEADETVVAPELELGDPRHAVDLSIKRDGLPVTYVPIEIHTADREGNRLEQIYSDTHNSLGFGDLLLNQGTEPLPDCWVVQAELGYEATFIDTDTNQIESLICREEDFVSEPRGRWQATLNFPVAGEPAPLVVGTDPTIVEGVVTGLPELLRIEADPGSTLVVTPAPGRDQGLPVYNKVGSEWEQLLGIIRQRWGRYDVPSSGEVILGTSAGSFIDEGDDYAFSVSIQTVETETVDLRDGSEVTIDASIAQRGEAVRYEMLAQAGALVLLDQEDVDPAVCETLTQSFQDSDGEFLQSDGPLTSCRTVGAFRAPDDGIIVFTTVGDHPTSFSFIVSQIT